MPRGTARLQFIDNWYIEHPDGGFGNTSWVFCPVAIIQPCSWKFPAHPLKFLPLITPWWLHLWSQLSHLRYQLPTELPLGEIPPTSCLLCQLLLAPVPSRTPPPLSPASWQCALGLYLPHGIVARSTESSNSSFVQGSDEHWPVLGFYLDSFGLAPYHHCLSRYINNGAAFSALS